MGVHWLLAGGIIAWRSLIPKATRIGKPAEKVGAAALFKQLFGGRKCLKNHHRTFHIQDFPISAIDGVGWKAMRQVSVHLILLSESLKGGLLFS